MKTRNLLLFALLIGTQIVPAQSLFSKFDLGISFVKNEYNGDYGSGILNFDQIYPAIGLSASTPINSSFDAGLQLSYGAYGFKVTEAHRFLGNKFDASLFGHYKFNNG